MTRYATIVFSLLIVCFEYWQNIPPQGCGGLFFFWPWHLVRFEVGLYFFFKYSSHHSEFVFLYPTSIFWSSLQARGCVYRHTQQVIHIPVRPEGHVSRFSPIGYGLAIVIPGPTNIAVQARAQGFNSDAVNVQPIPAPRSLDIPQKVHSLGLLHQQSFLNVVQFVDLGRRGHERQTYKSVSALQCEGRYRLCN